jgi:isoleucyl-tRNA synthetase
MKQLAVVLAGISQEEINGYETEGKLSLTVDHEAVELIAGDADVITEDIPGWVVASEGSLTVALDVTITDQLRDEGTARELVNRIQNIRKEKDFEVTDRISLEIEKNNGLNDALSNNYSYICSETLADSLKMVDSIDVSKRIVVDLTEDMQAVISVERVS